MHRADGTWLRAFLRWLRVSRQRHRVELARERAEVTMHYARLAIRRADQATDDLQWEISQRNLIAPAPARKK
jgi:hypothetical protein